MAQFYYVGDYGGPLTTEVYESDGVTPKLPSSATVDIINMDAGTTVVSAATCTVATGSAYYSIPSGSAATASGGHYVAYMSVLLDASNKLTNRIYYYVLNKSSDLVVERWRRKVENSTPNDDLIEDEDARDWIDQAVAFVNRHYYDTGFTSTLGTLSPSPTANDIEFFASVASLMARTSWWAGKGKWRDDELSMDPGPLRAEWAALDQKMQLIADRNTFAIYDTFNRDRVWADSYKYDSALWSYLPSGSTQPDTDIPI